MNSFTIVWDVLMTGEAVMQKKADVKLAQEMEAYADGIDFQTVQRWNHVAEGKKVSAQGFTNGLRFTSPIVDFANLNKTVSHLVNFQSDLAQSTDARIAERIEYPLQRETKTRLPLSGRMALQTTFTHGLGLEDHKKIQNAKSDQTRMTKDGLDPTRVGKNSSSAWFEDEFRALMSSSNWFLVLPTHGGQPSEVLDSKAGADGGVYEFSFNLQPAIDALTDESEGVWWSKLSAEQAQELNPTLNFNPQQPLDSPFDPAQYLHFNKTKDRIKNVLDFEQTQTGDEALQEELTYTLERMTRGRRILKQANSGDGLVSGQEKFVIGSKFITPFVCEEFFNAIGFFLMTRHPKFWRNGQSEVLIFHDELSLSIVDEVNI